MKVTSGKSLDCWLIKFLILNYIFAFEIALRDITMNCEG